MKKRSLFRWSVSFLLLFLLTSCATGKEPGPLPPTDTTPPTTVIPAFRSSETPPSIGSMTPEQPSQTLEFSDLNQAIWAARFSFWTPTLIPDDLKFDKAFVSNYADGSQNVSVMYAEPGDPLDANRKTLSVQMTRTDAPISRDSLAHQFKEIALDIREVQVRGQAGFTYWERSGAAGNSVILTWREGMVNIKLSLFGAWPQPDENNPHGLDSLLLSIADSLSPVNPIPAVTVQVLPPVIPSPTPDCQPATGVTLEVQRLTNTIVVLHASGLQPGEIPSVFYSTSVAGVGSKRGEAWGFVKGADERGEFSVQLTSLLPLDGQSEATWDIRLVHARGVACIEVTLP